MGPRALKRGGRWHGVPFEIHEAEMRYAAETAVDVSAEKLFERSWALTVLQRAFTQLEAEYAQAHRALLFDALKDRLSGEQAGTPYREVATALGMTEVAVSAAAHRLRRRYRELVRREIAQTVEVPAQIDDEVRALFTALGD